MLVTFLLPQVCLVAGEDTVLICQSNRTEQGDTKVYFATWAERTCLVVKYLKYLDPGCTDDCSTATHECEPVCWVKCSSSPEKVCLCFSSIQEKQINWQQRWKLIVWVKCSGSAEKDRSDLYFSLAFKLNFPLHLDVSWSKTESLSDLNTLRPQIELDCGGGKEALELKKSNTDTRYGMWVRVEVSCKHSNASAGKILTDQLFTLIIFAHLIGRNRYWKHW